MGNYCCLKNKQKRKIVVLLLGLDNAGKTVAAKSLAGESIEEVIPTMGFSVIHLSYINFRIEVFDLGGGSNIRGIWSRYFVDAHGIIFVVDSSDYARLNEVKDVLHDLLSHEKVSGKPVLLLANKQDNENALDELDLIESLQLEDLVNKEHCPTLVESCCATAKSSQLKLDPGIRKGYNWLLNYIVREYENLNRRVQNDVEEQEIIETQARQEIVDRLRMSKVNGETCKEADDIIELYSEYNKKISGIQTHNTSIVNSIDSNDSASEYSSDSLPHIYYGTVNDLVQENRPKSATQIIKDQLQLEHIQRKVYLKKSVNKTEPVTLLGVKLRHSAQESRTIVSNERRFLKSAGDNVFVVSDIMPNAVSYNAGDGDLHRQLFDMTRISIKQNGVTVPKYIDKAVNSINVD